MHVAGMVPQYNLGACHRAGLMEMVLHNRVIVWSWYYNYKNAEHYGRAGATPAQ